MKTSKAVSDKLVVSRAVEHAIAIQGQKVAEKEARGALTDALLRARSILRGSHGPAAVTRVGLAAALPRNNQKLVTHARHVVAQLTPDKLGDPVDQISPVDLDALREHLEQSADALETSLFDIERERREAHRPPPLRPTRAHRQRVRERGRRHKLKGCGSFWAIDQGFTQNADLSHESVA